MCFAHPDTMKMRFSGTFFSHQDANSEGVLLCVLCGFARNISGSHPGLPNAYFSGESSIRTTRFLTLLLFRKLHLSLKRLTTPAKQREAGDGRTCQENPGDDARGK